MFFIPKIVNLYQLLDEMRQYRKTKQLEMYGACYVSFSFVSFKMTFKHCFLCAWSFLHYLTTFMCDLLLLFPGVSPNSMERLARASIQMPKAFVAYISGQRLLAVILDSLFHFTRATPGISSQLVL